MMRSTRVISAGLHLVMLLSFVLVACTTQRASSAVSGAQMAEANILYEEGRFSEAVERYQALVDAGVQNGRLYYNLGDAYFKLNDLGRAILNFRRAQRLLPRDSDVTANLELARAQTLDQIELEKEGAFIRLVRRVIGWTTLNEAAIGALILWIVLCLLGIGAILFRERRRVFLYVSASVALLLLFGLITVGIRLLDERGQPPAVIVGTEVKVRSGPGQDYLTEFTLHAGAEVRVVEQRTDWMRIALPGDLQGWAPGDAVIEIRPGD